MLDVYTEWVRDFIGKEPKVKAFNGESRKSRFLGLHNIYACFHPGANRFGYNTALMNNMDESDIIAIAVHEAGHYWTMNNDYKSLLLFDLSLLGLIIIGFWQLSILLIIPYLFIEIKRDKSKNEYLAEEFVRKTIGPAMSFNNLMTLVCNSLEDCKRDSAPHWNEMVLTQVKDALKELKIDYENNDEI